MDSRDLDKLSNRVIGAAIEVHRTLGPGLLESAYQACLAHELELRALRVSREHGLPLEYKGVRLSSAYRVDLMVEGQLIVEVKAAERLLPVHAAQLLSYLRMSGNTLGLLLNFNVPVLKQGIKRVVNTF